MVNMTNFSFSWHKKFGLSAKSLSSIFHIMVYKLSSFELALICLNHVLGVTDDRGKFIYISPEELQAVAKFIKQRGRVTISELAESSNTLINLQTDKSHTDSTPLAQVTA